MSQSNSSSGHPSVFDRLIGPPLETSEVSHQAIGKVPALAVFASDALSSVAYATQEILVVLALAGSGYLGISIPVAIAIAVLLIILTLSYRQTIFAYPGGGGAYIVARDNLGELAAQVAGAALMTDYILTVAVSISSGVAQIISAFPSIYVFRVEIAIALIVMMAVINLRGVKESSTLLAVPTYFFIFSALLMLGVGLFQWATGTLNVVTGVESLHHTAEAMTLFLILRAFSSGCTALTGVEAISNGITAFKVPRSKNAAETLTVMSGILIVLFLGITTIAHQIQAVPSETETVISQIARTIYGPGALYLVTLVATTIILIMAANTSFADFPRLAALHAGDGFLPRQLTYRGNRLVFSWGIIALATLSSLLVIIFQASVSGLIPLYAIGVFLSFTMSQTGMVVRWHKISKLKPGDEVVTPGSVLHYTPSWRWRQIINIVGAIATTIVTIVFAVTKFTQGAWFITVLIPVLVYTFFKIHHHYKAVASQLGLGDLKIRPHASHARTLLLVDQVHAGTLRLVNFALSLGIPWEAVHICVDPEKSEITRERWKERIGIGELKIIDSPYRSITDPLRVYIHQLQKEDPDAFIHILVGQLAMNTFAEQLLHRNTSMLIDIVLRDMDRVVVTSVPYQIDLREQYVARLKRELELEIQIAEEMVADLPALVKETPSENPKSADEPQSKLK
jgi:amino acid transporter